MSEHSPVTAIPEDTCWQMLHEEEFGRLAFHLADEVHLVPINYAVDAVAAASSSALARAASCSA